MTTNTSDRNHEDDPKDFYVTMLGKYKIKHEIGNDRMNREINKNKMRNHLLPIGSIELTDNVVIDRYTINDTSVRKIYPGYKYRAMNAVPDIMHFGAYQEVAIVVNTDARMIMLKHIDKIWEPSPSQEQDLMIDILEESKGDLTINPIDKTNEDKDEHFEYVIPSSVFVPETPPRTPVPDLVPESQEDTVSSSSSSSSSIHDTPDSSESDHVRIVTGCPPDLPDNDFLNPPIPIHHQFMDWMCDDVTPLSPANNSSQAMLIEHETKLKEQHEINKHITLALKGHHDTLKAEHTTTNSLIEQQKIHNKIFRHHQRCIEIFEEQYDDITKCMTQLYLKQNNLKQKHLIMDQKLREVNSLVHHLKQYTEDFVNKKRKPKRKASQKSEKKLKLESKKDDTRSISPVISLGNDDAMICHESIDLTDNDDGGIMHEKPSLKSPPTKRRKLNTLKEYRTDTVKKIKK